jgi:hypothetical protein
MVPGHSFEGSLQLSPAFEHTTNGDPGSVLSSRRRYFFGGLDTLVNSEKPIKVAVTSFDSKLKLNGFKASALEQGCACEPVISDVPATTEITKCDSRSFMAAIR